MSKTNPVCRVCDAKLNDGNWNASRKKNQDHICKSCHAKWQYLWRKANPEKDRTIFTRHNRKRGNLPMDKNRECSSFLGVYVAERVLSHVFKNVNKMPMNNPGYDFVCSRGQMVDVKCSCKHHIKTHIYRWTFNIRKNQIADYFLFLAFDNREDLNPLHIWLIPGDRINDHMTVCISESRLDKWDKYRLNISKVATCCDTLRNQSAITTESPSLKSPAGTHS